MTVQGPDYSFVRSRISRIKQPALAAYFQDELRSSLTKMWCSAYRRSVPHAEIVEVPLGRFSYLFDLKAERNIAAYGITAGKNMMPRDKARMAGFPKAEDQTYHRGHMIPHGGHGGTDINLFIQRASVNVGPFRRLEHMAVVHSGSFYFVHLLYDVDNMLQRPNFVEQGLILNTTPPQLEHEFFQN